jgi:hypothetical protein
VLITAKRLLTKRRFVKSPCIEDIKNRYQALADPVKAQIYMIGVYWNDDTM